jgi:hypothetical protein
MGAVSGLISGTGSGVAATLAAIGAGGLDGATAGLILAIDTQLILRRPLPFLPLRRASSSSP